LPRIECIAIGSELLTTRRLDTNSVWLAERLAEMGLSLHCKTAVGDDREDMARLFRSALERSDIILCTGGLGPTFDDFTKDVWAEVVGVPLREDPVARAEMLAYYASRGRVPSPSNFQQVMLPEGSERVVNPVGTAPGVFWADPKGWPGRSIVLFPGVPREMKLMWEQQVAPRLRAHAADPVRTLRLVFGSMPESGLGERTQPLREKYRQMDWTILAVVSHVELVGRTSDPALLEAARADFARDLAPDLAFVGVEGGIEDTVVALLAARGETLAVAESMPGGNLAARVTSIPGASQVFPGGVTVYSARAKAALAGLDPGFIAAHGTVSEPVTAALAEAVRTRLGTTWGLAVTGNAGPTQDQDGPAPVGTTVMAVAGPAGTDVKTLHLWGGRAELQTRGATWALDMLRRKLGDGGGH
jgi:nicotinamide-nucleotide amidase